MLLCILLLLLPLWSLPCATAVILAPYLPKTFRTQMQAIHFSVQGQTKEDKISQADAGHSLFSRRPDPTRTKFRGKMKVIQFSVQGQTNEDVEHAPQILVNFLKNWARRQLTPQRVV